MDEIVTELKEFTTCLEQALPLADAAVKHKNTAYIKKFKEHLKALNRTYHYLLAKLKCIEKQVVKENVAKLEKEMTVVLGTGTYLDKIQAISRLELLLPQLEAEILGIRLHVPIFEIPTEIPVTEARIDLEEAIRDYENGCFISAIVLCRRAYEGALVETYISIEHKDPVEEARCKSCKAVLAPKRHLGITNLHKWAIEKGIIDEKFRQAGHLLSDLGAGGAHPPLKEFPRDKEVAKLEIMTTITLLKLIYVYSPEDSTQK
jgi:hypothetical protein